MAPMPLPEAIPVEEAEVAAVLNAIRRELQSTYAYQSSTADQNFIVNGTVEPTMAEVVIID